MNLAEVNNDANQPIQGMSSLTPLKKGWRSFQNGTCRFANSIEENIQVPSLMVRTFQAVINIFSMYPQIDIYLEIPKQFCKEAKNFTNIFRGFKSIDGFVNFRLQVKAIILNVSGLTLMIISAISVIDRFQILNVSVIKITLAALPILGVLPFGGLLPLSIIGLVGTTLFMGFEKQCRLHDTALKIRNDKLTYWSHFDLNKVQQKIQKYQRQFQYNPDRYQEKITRWRALERNWKQITGEHLQSFRQAKENKWKSKLNKIEQDKFSTLLSMITNITVISRQLFVVGAVMSGFGLVAIPFMVNLGFDLTGVCCDIGNLFMKNSIRQIHASSVNMTNYFVVD